MKKVLLTLCLTLSLSGIAQKNSVLLTINDTPVYTDEFKRVYEKNLHLVEDEESKNIDNYLKLFIDYKLKVNEAYELKLDTLASYQRELTMYKDQLAAPYLQDKALVNNLVREAYDRTKNEVRARHILIRFPKGMQSNDTLALYKKITDIRNKIVNGEKFEEVARQFSEDPSAKINGGDLGYFKAFRMVFPFEDAAYTTEVGKISMPFKTRFGYHILEVTDKRESKGSFEVAHILARDKSIVGKAKIDSAYVELTKGVSFSDVAKKYSEDIGTKTKGGKLQKFETGTMVAPFENAVLALKNNGEYSKPFRTKFGWHIVKLLNNDPVASFDELGPRLKGKILSSDRMKLSEAAVLKRLKAKYTIKVDKDALVVFNNKSLKDLKDVNLSKKLLSINNKHLTQKVFYTFSKKQSNKNVNERFEKFTNQEILNYFKANLVNTEPDYKNTLTEYTDGLLLFELMQQKIWNKASKDSVGLQSFYEKNKVSYGTKEFKKIKGKVINDYQKEIEDSWITELHAKNTVKIKKKTLKKLKKHYNQK